MDILVLGGTYFIGKVLVGLLADKHSVSILNRGTRKSSKNVSLIVADRYNHSAVEDGLRGKKFDVVIDFSGYNENDVATVLDCLGGRFGHYIFCSSIAVCSQPPVCWPITEDHAKCTSIKESEYGYNKWLAEQHLFLYSKKYNIPVSVVRPVYVYGPYDQSRRIDYFFERILERQPIIMSGNGENIVQFGYVYDLCQAITSIIGNKTAHGHVFNISGRELVTINQFLNLVSTVIGVKADARFDIQDQENQSTLTDKNRFADISKAERVLGIIPETSLIDGIKTTYKWWLTKRRRK
ncbi:MAG: NAD-dependent epimerase/dehydratase family protein [Patescibacteria group bacterium]|jgi:dTDP-glucose 4,6-dehydratase